MSGAGEPAAYEVVRQRLMRLRLRAGNPSYRQMGALWKGHPACEGRGGLVVFAAGTIADNLNGKRQAMSAPFVRFFVLSCLAYAQQMGIELPPQYLVKGLWHDWWTLQAACGDHDQVPGRDTALDGTPAHDDGPPVPARATTSSEAGDHPSGREGAGSDRVARTSSGENGDSARIPGPAGALCRRFSSHRRLSDSPYLPHPGKGLTPWSKSFAAADLVSSGGCQIEACGNGRPVPVWFPEVMQLCAQIVDSDPVLRGRVGSSRTITRPRGRVRCAHRPVGWAASIVATGN